MKAIIEFNFPDDQLEYDLMLQASNMYLALNQIEDELRHITKYGDITPAESDIYYKVRDRFYEIMNENNVNLNA
jgi:hypothetical protein